MKRQLFAVGALLLLSLTAPVIHAQAMSEASAAVVSSASGVVHTAQDAIRHIQRKEAGAPVADTQHLAKVSQRTGEGLGIAAAILMCLFYLPLAVLPLFTEKR